MSNKRIFYATQGLKLTPVVDYDPGTTMIPGGVQSVGVNTNFNLEKIFQLGQLELYDSVENNPQVEITINKVFDGTMPLFLMTMGGGYTDTTLVESANNQVNLDLVIYKDTDIGSSGNGEAALACTGLYASSFTYTFPTEGNATEEVKLIGNDKTWTASTGSATFSSPINSKGIARRWKFNKESSVFPTGDGGMKDAVLSEVSVSMDLGREAIYTLGEYTPYLRYVKFPVEINTEIKSIGTVGDFLNVNAQQYSCTGTSAVKNHEIKLVICGSGTEDSLTIDLGTQNKLQSVNYTGGDTGGGNVELSYSFTTNNSFRMTAAGTFQSDAGSGGNG